MNEFHAFERYVDASHFVPMFPPGICNNIKRNFIPRFSFLFYSVLRVKLSHPVISQTARKFLQSLVKFSSSPPCSVNVLRSYYATHGTVYHPSTLIDS